MVEGVGAVGGGAGVVGGAGAVADAVEGVVTIFGGGDVVGFDEFAFGVVAPDFGFWCGEVDVVGGVALTGSALTLADAVDGVGAAAVGDGGDGLGRGLEIGVGFICKRSVPLYSVAGC